MLFLRFVNQFLRRSKQSLSDEERWARGKFTFSELEVLNNRTEFNLQWC